jgi:signal transduction histidine kinase/ActR/RegA family two-component response regulator
MKLHVRILSAVAVCIILVEVPAYIVYRFWIFRSFSVLEMEAAERAAAGCRSVIETDLAHLNITTEDWAYWDATWTFVQGQNESYISENLGFDAFASLRINLLHIADEQGRRIFSQFYTADDKKQGIPSSISVFSNDALPPDSPFRLRHSDKTVKGILSTSRGLLLVVSRPVFHSDHSGPAKGSLTMGILIDREYLDNLAKQTRLSVQLFSAGDKEMTSDAAVRAAAHNDVDIVIQNDELLFADLFLRDLNGKLQGMIRAKIQRKIMEQGRSTHRFFVGALAATCVILLVLIHIFLYLTVVRRIKRLQAYVSNVDDPSSVAEPIRPDGTDEIGALTVAFNKMIARLDRSGQKKQMESLLALSGGVAHDLNNILGPAVALPGVVIEELKELSEAKQVDIKGILEDMEMISLSNRRAALVVNDLSIMSSMGRIRKEPISPRVIVKDVLRSQAVCEALAARPAVEVLQDLHATRKILGAEGPMSRLVLNLVINAIDAIDGPGALTVAVEDIFLTTPPFPIQDFAKGDYVVLKVSDTGSGIAVGDLSRIFEPFFTRKLGFGRRGSGLGLAIVNGVVQDFGGRIHVESRLGEGTRFSVLFPAIRESVNDMPQPRRSSLSPSAIATARILVVDDDDGQRRSAERILTREGYQVETSSDGHSALARFEGGETFSLVLLDMVMEDEFDGLDTFRALKSYQTDLRVLVVSGHAPSDRGREIIAQGAAWMPKPYTVDQLLDAIESLLKEPATNS